MTRVYNLGSHIFGSLSVASLVLGLALATQSVAFADLDPDTDNPGREGDCVSSAGACGKGSCTLPTGCVSKYDCQCT